MDSGNDADRTGEANWGTVSPVWGHSEDETIILHETDGRTGDVAADADGRSTSVEQTDHGKWGDEAEEDQDEEMLFDHASDEEDTWSGSLLEIISLTDTTAFITVAFHDGSFGTRDIPIRHLQQLYPTELAEHQRSTNIPIPAVAPPTIPADPIRSAVGPDETSTSPSPSTTSSISSSAAVRASSPPPPLSPKLAFTLESPPNTGSDWVVAGRSKRRKLN